MLYINLLGTKILRKSKIYPLLQVENQISSRPQLYPHLKKTETWKRPRTDACPQIPTPTH